MNKYIIYLRTNFWFNVIAGGSVGHTSEVINSFAKIKKVKVFTNDFLKDVDTTQNIIKPIFLKYLPFRFGELLYNYLIIRRIRSELHHAEFVYHRYSGFSFAGAYLSKKYKVPIVLEFNSSDVWKILNWSVIGRIKLVTKLIKLINYIRLPIIKKIERYNLYHAKHIIVVSDALREQIIDMDLGIDRNKIHVIPNGVNVEKYNPEINGTKIKKKYKIGGKTVIGFIGTFGQWHGVIEMAHAINLFISDNERLAENVKFLMIGDGLLKEEVKNIISVAGNEQHVIFTGIVPQELGREYLGACDILLSFHKKNPDHSKFFGSPTKLFEYMALGKAIIASDLDQLGDIIVDTKTGLLVEPENIEECAAAMKKLVLNPRLRADLGEKAREKVVRSHTWEKNVEAVIKIVTN